MKQSFLYKLFGLGAIPRKLRPVLEKEGIVLADEGMSGRLVLKNVKGPGKRYLRRVEGFLGCLVITRQRIICYTLWKRQINIAIDDPQLAEIYVDAEDKHTLLISFEASAFRDNWEGVFRYRFRTDKAMQFRDLLISLGARQGQQA